MRVLIAIITCEKFRARADAQRQTWVPNAACDVKFFLGALRRDPLPDEVFLPCLDAYEALPYKVQFMVRWALAHGYDKVLKCDDDVYVYPDRLLANIPEAEYAGHYSLGGFCGGIAYWLGPEAMKLIKHAPITTTLEDHWVGEVMKDAGIQAVHIPQFVLADSIPRHSCVKPDTQVACEFDPREMLTVHRIRPVVKKPSGMIRGDGTPFI